MTNVSVPPGEPFECSLHYRRVARAHNGQEARGRQRRKAFPLVYFGGSLAENGVIKSLLFIVQS